MLAETDMGGALAGNPLPQEEGPLAEKTTSKNLIDCLLDVENRDKLFGNEDNELLAVEMILSDSIARSALLKFLTSERSEENVLFCEATQSLMLSGNFDHDFTAIMSQYIEDDAPLQLNISHTLRMQLIAAHRSNPSDEKLLIDCMQKVQDEIHRVILGAFPRFQQSVFYREWNELELTTDGTVSATSDRTLTVLLVDDSLPVVKIMSRALSAKGFAVVVARDGVEALAKMYDSKLYAVLIDFMLPLQSGPEVVKQYRERAGQNLIIIGMSAFFDCDKEDACIKSGMNGFLRKPFSIDKFVLMINSQRVLHSIAEHRERRRSIIEMNGKRVVNASFRGSVPPRVSPPESASPSKSVRAGGSEQGGLVGSSSDATLRPNLMSPAAKEDKASVGRQAPSSPRTPVEEIHTVAAS